MDQVKKEVQKVRNEAKEVVELLGKINPDDKKEVMGIIKGYVLASDNKKKAG